jgi:RNA polymerase sigma factor (sigma-70 family)
MDNLVPPEQDARVRLTHDEAQELVLTTVATQAESLLRTAYRHSLCADDAHDAYQRGMEIFLRRARTLNPKTAGHWLHVVVKHEALEVRRGRTAAVAYEDVDFDRHTSPHSASPEEQALGAERTTRAAEALKRLKPQELRAMWLKALGHSYAEISAETGFSATKVNRCLSEGRKSFLERFEGIEAGAECERWQPVLSAIMDGEATAAQITEARPHLRNCPACRATLRGMDRARRPLAAVLPVGLFGAAGKLGGLVERLLPGSDAAPVAAGGAGMLGLGGTKLAALLVAGAAATAGGGLVVASESHQHVAGHKAAARPTERSRPTGIARATAPPPSTTPAAASAVVPAKVVHAAAKPHKAERVVARRHPSTARLEFAPHGAELAPAATPASTAAKVARATAPTAVPAPAPGADTSRGEFSPQP